MRLICPNCGAQYEVPTEVIPESGRDVQCSDCGTTWFQHHPDHPPAEPEEPPATPVETTVAPDASDAQDDGADYGADDDDQDTWDEPAKAAPSDPKRREVDPAVADVLREEAEREARAREDDMRGSVETQQDLGLQETDGDAQRRSDEARARMARLRGMSEPDSPDAALDDIDPSSRSNLLPDIDEINSSLNSDTARDEVAPPPPEPDPVVKPGKSGFRSGFRLAVILAVLALALYVFAPQLGEAVPALAEPLSSYVNMVNSWRSGLDGLIENFAQSLSGEEATGE